MLGTSGWATGVVGMGILRSQAYADLFFIDIPAKPTSSTSACVGEDRSHARDVIR